MCFGEFVGKYVKFEERFGCDLMYSECLIVLEMKEWYVEKMVGYDIRLLLMECFDSYDVILIYINEVVKGDVWDGICNVNVELEVNSVGRCVIVGKWLYVIDFGVLDFVDIFIDIDVEVIDSIDY